MEVAFQCYNNFHCILVPLCMCVWICDGEKW